MRVLAQGERGGCADLAEALGATQHNLPLPPQGGGPGAAESHAAAPSAEIPCPEPWRGLAQTAPSAAPPAIPRLVLHSQVPRRNEQRRRWRWRVEQSDIAGHGQRGRVLDVAENLGRGCDAAHRVQRHQLVSCQRGNRKEEIKCGQMCGSGKERQRYMEKVNEASQVGALVSNTTLLAKYCRDRVPRSCDHAVLQNASRPCTLGESFVSSGSSLTIEMRMTESTALR